MIFMYCRRRGWMHDREGVGVPQCGNPARGKLGACFVSGEEDELKHFRWAISINPENYKRFPSTDYWDQSWGKKNSQTA